MNNTKTLLQLWTYFTIFNTHFARHRISSKMIEQKKVGMYFCNTKNYKNTFQPWRRVALANKKKVGMYFCDTKNYKNTFHPWRRVALASSNIQWQFRDMICIYQSTIFLKWIIHIFRLVFRFKAFLKMTFHQRI